MNKRILKASLWVVLLFVIDRLAKWFAMNVLPSQGFFAIPRTMGIVLERNQGIAYSIFLPRTALIILTLLIIIVLISLATRAYRRGEAQAVMALSLIIVGAFSNLLDRIKYGYVVDMFVLTSWPVFNLADLMITAGAVWLVVLLIKSSNKN